jgi:NAD-dependent dihydropyrimidine dehydrogenase PreA subunit
LLAHYGYKDGSGEYFIVIDTDKCIDCGKTCVDACPAGVLVEIEDDYGDRVASVTEEHRKKIKYSCAPCKPTSGAGAPPCLLSCEPKAMTHSW